MRRSVVTGGAWLASLVLAGTGLAAPTASVGILASVINPPVFGLGSLVSRLVVTQSPATLGQPAQFVLYVTNTGGSTITNLTAALWTDGRATIGASMPTAVAEVTPGSTASFTWTVIPAEARTLTFSSIAAGFTMSASGTVPVAAAQVAAVLQGIVVPGTSETYVFPSPARDATRIAYRMAESGTVRIRVYNAAGQLVATLEEAKPVGVQFSPLTTARLAPGVYFYLVERTYESGTRDRSGSGKFAVIR